jgi:hypothetical protein
MSNGQPETGTDPEGNTTFTIRKSSLVDPSGQPTSSPGTTVATPVTPPPPATGTGNSTDTQGFSASAAAVGAAPPSAGGFTADSVATTASIWIATALPSSTINAVTIQFDYMPEDITFGVTANFLPHQITFTSARWLQYQNTDIDEVSLTVKVVSGCNNAITYYAGNTAGSGFLARSPLRVGLYQRNNLINLAKALYLLPLPGSNDWIDGKGSPPPTCRLNVGKMFSGIGAFSRCSIKFNGPYDFDGSPTDMDVTLGFLPSEYYASSSFPGSEAPANLKPISTPDGQQQVQGGHPYALTFGNTQEGAIPAAPGYSDPNAPTAANTPNQGPELVGQTPATVPQAAVQGPQTPTPTNQEVAIATNTPENEVFYNSAKDTYMLGGTFTPGGVPVGGTEYSGDNIRKQVANSKTPNLGGGD